MWERRLYALHDISGTETKTQWGAPTTEKKHIVLLVVQLFICFSGSGLVAINYSKMEVTGKSLTYSHT